MAGLRASPRGASRSRRRPCRSCRPISKWSTRSKRGCGCLQGASCGSPGRVQHGMGRSLASARSLAAFAPTARTSRYGMSSKRVGAGTRPSKARASMFARSWGYSRRWSVGRCEIVVCSARVREASMRRGSGGRFEIAEPLSAAMSSPLPCTTRGVWSLLPLLVPFVPTVAPLHGPTGCLTVRAHIMRHRGCRPSSLRQWSDLASVRY